MSNSKTHQDVGPRRCSCIPCQNRRLTQAAGMPPGACRAGYFHRTDIEGRIIKFMRDYQAENMRPPTGREIMLGLGWKSPRAVSYHTDRMLAEGKLIRRGSGTSRNLFIP